MDKLLEPAAAVLLFLAARAVAAAAAAQGLMQSTPALQAEIERFNPVSQEEKNQERINWLKSQNPYGTPGRYLDSGEYVPPVKENVTLAMQLDALISSEESAAMKAAASPVPTPEQVYEQQQALAQANAELRLRSIQHSFAPVGETGRRIVVCWIEVFEETGSRCLFALDLNDVLAKQGTETSSISSSSAEHV